MTLTARQRTKINAALCLIHDLGHKASDVINLANQHIRGGTDPRTAYERSLNTFLGNAPDLMPVVSKVLRLVDASDDKTVDQYDAALDSYIATGDDSSINALAPTIAEDSLALAVREGELTQEEADSGDLAKALGFEPGPALQEAVNPDQPTGEQASVPQQQPAQAWQQQSQQGGNAPGALSLTNSSQVSLGGPTGYVALAARAKIARETGVMQVPSADGAQAT